MRSLKMDQPLMRTHVTTRPRFTPPPRYFQCCQNNLSTNLTSLNVNEDRLAIVVEMVIAADGSLQDSDIYRARVRNHAQLAYNSVAAWLEGGKLPDAIATVTQGIG